MKKRNGWKIINDTLNLKTEAEVKDLLDFEVENERRATILVRLHQRWSALRTARERIELLLKAQRP